MCDEIGLSFDCFAHACHTPFLSTNSILLHNSLTFHVLIFFANVQSSRASLVIALLFIDVTNGYFGWSSSNEVNYIEERYGMRQCSILF